MATTTFFCAECDMSFNDEMDVRNHISAMHLSYFPYKCFTCKKSGANHETVNAEHMYQHISTQHEGIIPDVRFSFLDFPSKQNELKVAIQNCRRSSAEQTLPNDSKIPLSRVFISTGTTLDGIGNSAPENISILTELNQEASEFEVNANSNNMIRTGDWPTHSIQPNNGSTEPNFGLDLQIINENARLFSTAENELDVYTGNCRRPEQASLNDSKHAMRQIFISFCDTLVDTKNGATENGVTSTEIKQEGGWLEVHESTNKDNIVTTNEVMTHSTQPESGSVCGHESNSNVNLQGIIEVLHNAVTTATRRMPRRKRKNVSSSIRFKRPQLRRESLVNKQSARPATDVNTLCVQRSSEMNQSSPNHSNGKINEIDDWNGILVDGSGRKKFDKFAQEIHSIAHLWANGRVVADLHKYPENENEALPVSNVCDALFNKNQSILACNQLEIKLADNWPFSVVTSAASRCNQLILEETRRKYVGETRRGQLLHHRLLDAFYERKIPTHTEVTLNLCLNVSTDEFINELKRQFHRTTEQNFKLALLFPPKYGKKKSKELSNMLLRNKHGLILTTTIHASHKKDRSCVMIDQHTPS